MCNDTTFQLVVLVWFTCTSTSSFAIVLPAVPAGRICFGPACIVLGCDEATEYVLVVNGCYKKWIIKDFNSLYLRPFLLLILYKRAWLLQRDMKCSYPWLRLVIVWYCNFYDLLISRCRHCFERYWTSSFSGWREDWLRLPYRCCILCCRFLCSTRNDSNVLYFVAYLYFL